MKRKWIALLGIATLLCVGVFAGAGTAAADQKELHLGYLVADQIHGSALMVMKERRMLESQGFKVAWGEFLAGSYLMQEMASGSLDFGVCGVVPVMITRGQGVDAVILASANTEGSSLVVKDSIKTVKDLDGKSIGTPGIGSIQDALVVKLATANNIKVLRKSMKVSDMPIFLQKGEIDGFIAWAPHAARAVDLHYGHELVTSKDLLPEHQCCVFVVNGALLKKDPQTARTVLKTYLEAYQWAQEHPDEVVAMVMKYTGMKKEVISAAMKIVKYPNPPYCNLDSMKMMAETLIESGKIQKGVISDMNAFLKDLYRPSLLEELSAKK